MNPEAAIPPQDAPGALDPPRDNGNSHEPAVRDATGEETTDAPPEVDKPPQSKAAERQRRYRRLQKSGRIIIPIEVDRDTIQALEDEGWFLPLEKETKARIGAASRASLSDAITDLLDCWARGMLKNRKSDASRSQDDSHSQDDSQVAESDGQIVERTEIDHGQQSQNIQGRASFRLRRAKREGTRPKNGIDARKN